MPSGKQLKIGSQMSMAVSPQESKTLKLYISAGSNEDGKYLRDVKIHTVFYAMAHREREAFIRMGNS